MVKPTHVAETRATRLLREHGLAFTEHVYPYVEHGGTAHPAQWLGLAEYAIIKTLIMERETGEPLIVLMHGTHRVLTKELARQIGAKRIEPCAPPTAQRHSGYWVGGTSPLATRRPMRVYAERSIFALPRIFLNGGKRGYLVGLEPSSLGAVLEIQTVECASQD
ncbi:MAG: YbaK/EbsC family protein [Burkholderiaceae bacterium]|jgi:Cys-tRNA(Pro) deacylase